MIEQCAGGLFVKVKRSSAALKNDHRVDDGSGTEQTIALGIKLSSKGAIKAHQQSDRDTSCNAGVEILGREIEAVSPHDCVHVYIDCSEHCCIV